MTDSDQPRRKTLIERVLAPIAEVHREEAAIALLMTLLMFLVLGAFYMLKTAREVLILTEGGAEIKSYSSGAQAVLLLAIIPAYSAFASRVKRGQLVTWVTLFFASNIVLFVAAAGAGLRIGVVYFLWLGIFSAMVISQFWAFANDLYTEEQGKRLFPLLGVGASLGAWIGALRAGDLIALGTTRVLAGGMGLLVVCALLARIIDRRATSRPGPARAARAADTPLDKSGAFSLIRSDRYLMLIAFLTLVLNIVNTSGEYLFGRYVVEQSLALYGAGPETAPDRERFVGEVYTRLFSTVNLVGFLLQTFVVSRVFKFIGITRALFVQPVVALTGYLVLMRAPSLSTMAVLKVADNSLDYSLGSTVKQALWLPTSREAKYKAKQAVDSFFVRAGDLVQAGIVFAGEGLRLTVPAFAAVNVALAGGWLVLATMINSTKAEKVVPAQTVQ